MLRLVEGYFGCILPTRRYYYCTYDSADYVGNPAPSVSWFARFSRQEDKTPKSRAAEQALEARLADS